MLLTDQNPHNRSIMASVLGIPNAGKSTLINYLIGMDLSIVTNREQTTRNRFHCVFTVDHTEIILVDTPGLHISNKEINRRMNEQAVEGTFGSDINLLLIDLTRKIAPQFETLAKSFAEHDLSRSWVIFTKCDRVKNYETLPLDNVIEKAKEVIPGIEKYFILSGQEGENVHLLTGALCDEAAPGPHRYQEGKISNKNERFFATEYVRQQTFELIKDEVPYEIAVVLEEFSELFTPVDKASFNYETDVKGKDGKVDFEDKDLQRKLKKAFYDDDKTIERKAVISCSILVNRPSQRAIVVGSKGSMIKEIGTRARKKIEEMTDAKVHLNLHVKVSPRWFKNNFVLEEIGLPRAKDSARVWRKK